MLEDKLTPPACAAEAKRFPIAIEALRPVPVTSAALVASAPLALLELIAEPETVALCASGVPEPEIPDSTSAVPATVAEEAASTPFAMLSLIAVPTTLAALASGEPLAEEDDSAVPATVAAPAAGFPSP